MPTGLLKFLLIVAIWAVGLIPVWLWLAVQHVLQAECFWQNLVLVGAGFYVLGGFQFILGIVAIIFTIIALFAEW